jgi:hypothetical protein
MIALVATLFTATADTAAFAAFAAFSHIFLYKGYIKKNDFKKLKLIYHLINPCGVC